MAATETSPIPRHTHLFPYELARAKVSLPQFRHRSTPPRTSPPPPDSTPAG